MKNLIQLILILSFSLITNAAEKEVQTDLLRLKPSTLPNAGKAGDVRLDTNDDKIKKWSPSKTQWQVIAGSGSGGSGTNYFSDFEAENVSLFQTYNDTTSLPVDGVGGTASLVTTSIDSTSKISGQTSFKFAKALGNATGQGASFLSDVAFDGKAKSGQPLTIQVSYLTSSTYVSGSVKLYVYHIGSNILEALSGVDGLGNYSNSLNLDTTGRGQFTASISANSTDTGFRVLAHVTDSTNAAYDVFFDQIKIGFDAVIQSGGGTIGEILTFPSSATPQGFLKCDGSAVSRSTYADLFAVIGTTHGQGDGSTTFNLPDYRGRFLRGVDGTAGNDPDKASRAAMATGGNAGNNVGSVQADAMQGHVHNMNGTAINSGNGSAYPLMQDNFQSRMVAVGGPINDGTNGTPRVSSETRGKNANVEFFIRFKKDEGNTLTSTQAEFRTPRFRAFRSTSTAAATGTTDYVADSVTYNDQGIYNTTTGYFRPNKTGEWKVTSFTILNGAKTLGNAAQVNLVRVSDSVVVSQIARTVFHVSNPSLESTFTNSVPVRLTAGVDYKFQVLRGSDSNSIYGDSTGWYGFVAAEYIPDVSVIGNAGTPFEVKNSASAVYTPTASLVWHPLSGNGVLLTEGVWSATCLVATYSPSSSAQTSYLAVNIAAVNGNNTGSLPADPNTFINLANIRRETASALPNVNNFGSNSPQVIVRVLSPTTFYCNAFTSQVTNGNLRIEATITATRLR